MRILLPPSIWDEVMKGGRAWKGKWPFLGKRLGKFPPPHVILRIVIVVVILGVGTGHAC